MKELEKLDEKGFVFKGADGKPYLCRIWGENPWFFYWHPDHRWVSLKKVNQTDVWLANNQSMTEEESNCYMNLQKEKFGF